MIDPDQPDDVEDDGELVSAAQQGDEQALSALVRRHQGWIYGLALRMVGRPEDAEDASQEVLVKVVTSLSTFKQKSGFRTWLYRICVNHLINRRRSRWERLFRSFDRLATFKEGLERGRWGGQQPEIEAGLLVEETKMACLTGMLLCLDRPQRIVFILGSILGLHSGLGAELLDMSPDNFRQMLSRARRQLGSFMNEQCGLINESKPCRCATKTKACIAAGLVDPRRLRFTPEHLQRVKGFVSAKAWLVDTALEMRVEELFKRQPQLQAPDMLPVLKRLLRQKDLQAVVDFH